MDDSCFCDQCGVQLLHCEKCGFVGTSKFCGKCGGNMSAIQPAIAQSTTAQPQIVQPSGEQLTLSPSPVVPENKTTIAPSTAIPGATVIIQFPSEKISLCHPEGWKLEIVNNEILGRVNGPHAAQLGRYPVISSTHAKVTQDNNTWFITDLNSTNKTYVNGVKLEPNVPAKIKQDDIVVLANITFTVRMA
jgi:hypothetical protein